MVFVYTISAMLIIPIFFYRTQSRCKSLNLGHYVGLTIAFIYFLFYGVFLNSIDGVINTYLFFSGLMPNFLRFLPDFLATIVKESWDETKLAPFYSIPIFGQIIMVYHHTIEVGLIYLKEFLDQESKYGCDNSLKYKNLQELLASIVYKNKKNDREGYVNDISRTQPRDSYTTSMMREFIKYFNLEPSVFLANIGFNEDEKYESGYESKPYFEKAFDANYWDWRASWFVKAMTCLVLQFGGITNLFIDEMNGPLSVANMIKTGNIAGMFTATAYFIIIVLAIFLSSMYGISI